MPGEKKPRPPKRVWDNMVHIGDVQKSAALKFRVELVARDGAKYINIREMYKRKDQTEWFPSNIGIGVVIEIPIAGKRHYPFSELLDLMLKAAEMAPTFAIQDDEHSVFYTKPVKEDAVDDN